MISAINIIIKNTVLHKVQNRLRDEGIQLSKSYLNIKDSLQETLINYFFTPFKNQEYFQLSHESDIKYNEVFGCISEIFDNPETLHEQSINLAKHLYEKSNHPKIKGGEFYVVYFQDCILEGETLDAVGLFKSENKDTFLKVFPDGDNYSIESEQGVNINKLDKGALIFNTEKENGYVVAVVDNTNRGAEAQYWIDEFLHVRQRQDEYFNTKNVIDLTKNFIMKELPQEFENVSKADQVDLLNRSAQFLKQNNDFDMETFANEVIVQPEAIESFHRYKESFAEERDIEIADSFAISDAAAKKGARTLKSVIKLDKNFHIYIHGDRSKIETGEDEKGKYYKVYFKEEM